SCSSGIRWPTWRSRRSTSGRSSSASSAPAARPIPRPRFAREGLLVVRGRGGAEADELSRRLLAQSGHQLRDRARRGVVHRPGDVRPRRAAGGLLPGRDAALLRRGHPDLAPRAVRGLGVGDRRRHLPGRAQPVPALPGELRRPQVRDAARRAAAGDDPGRPVRRVGAVRPGDSRGDPHHAGDRGDVPGRGGGGEHAPLHDLPAAATRSVLGRQLLEPARGPPDRREPAGRAAAAALALPGVVADRARRPPLPVPVLIPGGRAPGPRLAGGIRGGARGRGRLVRRLRGSQRGHLASGDAAVHRGGHVIRYLRLYGYFLRFSFSRALEFRFDFFFRIGMDTLWYAHHLAFFWILYRHTTLLGGWTLDQMYIFAGGVFLMDGIQMTMTANNTWMLPILVNKGDVDYYLMRPVSSLFFLSLRDFAANS